MTMSATPERNDHCLLYGRMRAFARRPLATERLGKGILMRLFIATALALVAFLSMSATAIAAGGSDAKRCLDWDANLQTETGGTFTSYEECLAYAKHSKLYQPLVVNSPASVGSLETSSLQGTGFHRNVQLTVLFFIEGYELPGIPSGGGPAVTDNRGQLELPWTLFDCAIVPGGFGEAPYDVYFLVFEGNPFDPNYQGGLHARTDFSIC
jgi:hypothetical protein